MSGSVNKVILVGNVGRDPEVRMNQNGSKIVNLSIATSETWKDRQSGERKEKTEWHRVVIFDDRLAETAEKYLKKGATVYIEGQLQTRKWTDQSGAEKFSTEVVLQKFRGDLTLLGKPRGEGQESQERQSQWSSGYGGGYGSQGGGYGRAPDIDDEIPF